MDIARNYNEMTQAERRILRENYIKKQKGLCYYCNSNLSESPPNKILKTKINEKLFPKNFFNCQYIYITTTKPVLQSVLSIVAAMPFCGNTTENKE